MDILQSEVAALVSEEHKPFEGVRLLVFDLDGTLIDSKLDLALAVNAAREHLGLPPLQHEEIFGYVGHGASLLIRRSLGATPSEEQVERALQFFLEYYVKHMLDNTLTYPGVREALAELAARGFGPGKERPMAVLTNKPVRFSERIIEGLGLSGYFRHVYGGNSFEKKKPDPVGVETLLRDCKAQPREAMVIGDSEIDIQTARNAGTWACGVTYGMGSHMLAEYPPDLLLDSLAELPAHLNAR